MNFTKPGDFNANVTHHQGELKMFRFHLDHYSIRLIYATHTTGEGRDIRDEWSDVPYITSCNSAFYF